MERLDFYLPELTRCAWVSDEARAVWEPRVQRIAQAWSEMTWRSIPMGLRAAALVHVSPDALDGEARRWAEYGLGGVLLPTPDRQPRGDPALRVAVGTPRTAHQLKRYRDKGDHESIGRLLGFPSCCRKFFQRVWVRERFIDTTWAMATGSAPRITSRTIEVHGEPACNILHRWIGVRAVQHLPCGFACEPSARQGAEFLAAARQAGFAQEVDWIQEILSWPVEWSALHGIAEIRSPILKVVTQTDATRTKYTVQWQGTAYPREGAAGLRFPYRRRGECGSTSQPIPLSTLKSALAAPAAQVS